MWVNNHVLIFISYFKSRVVKTVQGWHRDRYVDNWNRLENPQSKFMYAGCSGLVWRVSPLMVYGFLVALWETVEDLGGKIYSGKLGHQEHTLESDTWSQLLLSRFGSPIPWGELCTPATFSSQDVLWHDNPKITGPSLHGLKSLKPWAKNRTSLPFKLIVSGILWQCQKAA